MESNNIPTYKFLTALDALQPHWLYNGGHTFSSDLYKTEDNIHNIIEVIKRGDERYNEFAKMLEFMPKRKDATTKYLQTRIPLVMEIEQKYFKSKENNKLVKTLSVFINHFLTCIEHVYLSIGLPRFILDGRKIFWKPANTDAWEGISYDVSIIPLDQIFLEYSLMNDQGHTDVACMLIADINSIKTNWRLLVDGIGYYYEQAYREVCINCCMAIELEISPQVHSWLKEQTVTEPKQAIQNAVREMGNPLRFEIFFKKIAYDALRIYTVKETASLLQKLKSLNSIRNKVVHDGYEPNEHESSEAILATGRFLRAMWVYRKPLISQR